MNNWFCWINSLNPNEIIISVSVGIFTGIIASIIYALMIFSRKRKQLRNKFEPISGKYIRWYNDNKNSNRIHAKANIKYLDENKLSIAVQTFINKDSGVDFSPKKIQLWTGEITMESIRSGSIIWEQRNPNNGNNGYKKIIVEKDLSGITLIGEMRIEKGEIKGWGVEKFTEKEKRHIDAKK